MSRERAEATAPSGGGPLGLDTAAAAALAPADVLARLETSDHGLASNEAARRLAAVGHNALRSHGTRPWRVLERQFHSYLLLLLLAAAVVSATVGEGTEVLLGMVVTYLALVEVGKYFFFKRRIVVRPLAVARPPHARRVDRVAAAWSHRHVPGTPLPH